VLSREGGARRACSTGIVAPAQVADLLVLGTVVVWPWVQIWYSVLNSERDKNSLFCPTGKVLREFSPDIRANLGNDLHRPEDGLEPLDSGSMGATLPHVHKIRNQDTERWCRVLYIRLRRLTLRAPLLHEDDQTGPSLCTTANERVSSLSVLVFAIAYCCCARILPLRDFGDFIQAFSGEYTSSFSTGIGMVPRKTVQNPSRLYGCVTFT
jgi:phage-related protein